MNDDPVYLWVRAQDAWDFLRYICNRGTGEGQGEPPPQMNVPEDGFPHDKCHGLLFEGGGQSSGPIVPVRRPGMMPLTVGRTPEVPPHRVPEELQLG